MTNDKDSTCNNSQQQQPFQVVLIDIQKAAKGEIYCVKKPLTEELNYVAVSYRWGELQETNVDTRVGYVASITSFDLQDFCELCASMTKEPDLKSMDYVWVDTICVNQSNYNERKATIYHMTDIFEQAKWILAVPDLHAEYLRRNMTSHNQIMQYIQQHRSYFFHLLNRNTKELESMDASFLDAINVPQDSALRQLLTKYTKCFADGFTRISSSSCHYNDDLVLPHLFDIYQHSFKNDSDNYKANDWWLFIDSKLMGEIYSLHECNDGKNCPFEYRGYTCYPRGNGRWYIDIIERSKRIRQAMYFLKDIVVDWSSRVWVISEIHIAKKKNNLKFWFAQLNDGKAALKFIKFDMDDTRLKAIEKRGCDISNDYLPTPDEVYLYFYEKLIHQLNSQTFLEMMLKSKASRHEDRFYSIFPLFPRYKDLLQRENDLINSVNSILSVKLKLYQLMANENKILLFFLSAEGNTTYTLPTFATALIHWPEPKYYIPLVHKAYTSDVKIVLFHKTTVDNGSQSYLGVRSWNCEIAQAKVGTDTAVGRTLTQLLHSKRKILCLETDDADTLIVDVVVMSEAVLIILLGSVHENIWILAKDDDYEVVSEFNDIENLTGDGFHVY